MEGYMDERVLKTNKLRGFDLWSRFSGAEQEGVVGEQNVCILDGPIEATTICAFKALDKIINTEIRDTYLHDRSASHASRAAGIAQPPTLTLNPQHITFPNNSRGI
jgi:hypothetical protein